MESEGHDGGTVVRVCIASWQVPDVTGGDWRRLSMTQNHRYLEELLIKSDVDDGVASTSVYIAGMRRGR